MIIYLFIYLFNERSLMILNDLIIFLMIFNDIINLI